MIENSRHLAQDYTAKIQDLFDAPEEYEIINNNLKFVSGYVQKIRDEIETTKGFHEKDLEVLEDISETSAGAGAAFEKIESLVSRINAYCDFDGFHFFIKDRNSDVLNRVFPVEPGSDGFNVINLRDADSARFAGILRSRNIEIIDKVRTNSSLRPSIREWAEKKDIRRLFIIPVIAAGKAQGLLMFSKPSPTELSIGQRTVLKVVMGIIGDLIVQEMSAQEQKDKFSHLEVENNIYSILMKAQKFEELVKSFLVAFKNLVPMDFGTITVINDEEDKGTCTMYLLDLTDGEQELKKSVIPLEGSGAAWVMENGRPWVEEDLRLSLIHI